MERGEGSQSAAGLIDIATHRTLDGLDEVAGIHLASHPAPVRAVENRFPEQRAFQRQRRELSL